MSAADYYATSPGELLGRGFDHLDISGKSARDVFECLTYNLDPATGHILRKRAKGKRPLDRRGCALNSGEAS